VEILLIELTACINYRFNQYGKFLYVNIWLCFRQKPNSWNKPINKSQNEAKYNSVHDGGIILILSSDRPGFELAYKIKRQWHTTQRCLFNYSDVASKIRIKQTKVNQILKYKY